MSKTKSDHLFRLIKTLSKGEKLFFKLYVSRLSGSENKKFIILFNAIDKQKEYNEELILSKEKAINPKQFSNLKAHLYYQLLKCLKLCNTNNLDTINIIELLNYARILYSKGLYKECIKMIDKVKKMAIENDYSILLLEILELEKLVIPKTLNEGNERRVNIVITETVKVAESIKNINIFSNLALKLNSYYVQTGFIKNKADLERITYLFSSSLPPYKKNTLSFQEKLYLYNSYIGYYLFIQDFKQANIYADKLVKLFDEQPEMKRHKLEMYIKALNNLLVAQHKLYKYNEFVATQKKLVAIKRDKTLVLTENINLNLFKTIYFHEINRHFMSGEFKSGTRIVAALESEINKFISRLDKHSVLLFYYKISCLYFGSNNFKIALKWLNKILNEREINLREDLYSFSRILSLICHFELEHSDLIESNIKSTYRYFMKKGDLTIYQTHILDFLKRILKDSSDKSLKKGLIQLKNEMEQLEKNRFEKRAFIYFDILSWLESKLEKRTVQEVIKEKSLKRIGQIETSSEK